MTNRTFISSLPQTSIMMTIRLLTGSLVGRPLVESARPQDNLTLKKYKHLEPSYKYKLVTEDKIHPDRRIEFTDLFEIKQN